MMIVIVYSIIPVAPIINPVVVNVKTCQGAAGVPVCSVSAPISIIDCDKRNLDWSIICSIRKCDACKHIMHETICNNYILYAITITIVKKYSYTIATRI